MQVSELFKQSNTILLDGGMGTMLQAAGLKLGARPEELNITDPALIEGIHGQYAAAGSRIVNANTFGASAHKLAGSAYTLEQVITAGIENCKRACAPYGALTALDVGPLGELLEPSGTLAFEDAVAEYARIVKAGEAAGADLIFFETYTDLYELKAALLAAKENTHLPILASMSFEAGGRTFTGCTVESFGVRPQVKWPNDIYIDGRKVAGILIENDLAGNFLSRSVVGIGINVNQTEFDPALPNPTSLAVAAGRKLDRAEVFRLFYEKMSFRYGQLQQQRYAAMDTDYAARLYRLGETHSFVDGRTKVRFEGTICGVLPTGELEVRHRDGQMHRYLFKEIEYTITGIG